jgi:hypothetical protein
MKMIEDSEALAAFGSSPCYTFPTEIRDMAKGIRKNISVPGLLTQALHLRTREFGHRTVSPLVIDLVCYDLRSCAPHPITLAISQDTQAAQDAVDAELAARYQPGQQRNGLLVEFIEHLAEIRSVARHAGACLPLKTKAEHVMFPAGIWPLADIRWRELGYASLSAYVTGLIRYDLLLSGPHKFDARHTRRKIQAMLDRETRKAHERGQSRKLFLDYLIERVHGQALTSAELQREKKAIALKLLRHVKHPEASGRPPANSASKRHSKRILH